MSVIKRANQSEGVGRPFLFDQRLPSHAHDSALHSGSSDVEQSDTETGAVDPVEALNARLSRMADQLAVAKAQLEQVRTEAKAEGFAEGQLAAETREQERIDLLADAARQASANVLQAVDTHRDLAIEIARATVATILGNNGEFAALVTATAHKWAEELKSSAVVGLRVSGHDFADPADALRLEAATGGAPVTVQQDLPAGSCIFDLELGQLDASIPGQAARADAFLHKHAVGASVAA